MVDPVAEAAIAERFAADLEAGHLETFPRDQVRYVERDDRTG